MDIELERRRADAEAEREQQELTRQAAERAHWKNLAKGSVGGEARTFSAGERWRHFRELR